jgi:hypothetical protein
MTIDVQTNLFRYDIIEPPENWDTNFRNPEYETEEYGHKNKANLFFFTDSEDIAKDLGQGSANKRCLNEYFLTKSKTESCLTLIDFNNRQNIYQMLCLLNDLKINVLTIDFKTYEGDSTFLDLKSIFDNAEVETHLLKKASIVSQLKVHSKSNVTDISLFGQRLTDFDNGLKFKSIINDIYPKIDGYRWKEYNDDRGITYCLFDSKKLSQKWTEKIKVSK